MRRMTWASRGSNPRRRRFESPVPEPDRAQRTAGQLFGTDGIRGTAGDFPLDPPTVRRIGAAIVRGVAQSVARPRLLIGRDTRESGSWIEAELAWGASGEGASVASAGVVP